jgi:hypothetical protein
MDKKDTSNAGIGLAIGAGVGITIGTIMGNLHVWMPIGAVLGLIFGGYWKSLTHQDKSRKDVVK